MTCPACAERIRGTTPSRVEHLVRRWSSAWQVPRVQVHRMLFANVMLGFKEETVLRHGPGLEHPVRVQFSVKPKAHLSVHL